MQRLITGFSRDDLGDWVAQLSCGHRQHVRHNPPFQLRPWALDPEGRTGRLGSPIECPLCDRLTDDRDARDNDIGSAGRRDGGRPRLLGTSVVP